MSDVRPPRYTPHPAVSNSGGYQQQYGQPAPNYANTRPTTAPFANLAADRPVAVDVEELDDGVTGSKQGYVTPKIPREYMRVSDHIRILAVSNRISNLA